MRTTKNILLSLSHQSIHHPHTGPLRVLKANPPILRSVQTNSHHARLFASQTLLSRTDFESKSSVELREELNKRGIVTGAKKKSILIEKILEDERKRMISNMSTKKVAPKKEVDNPSKVTAPLTEGKPATKPSPTPTLQGPIVSPISPVGTRSMRGSSELPRKEAPTKVMPPPIEGNLNPSTESSSSTTLSEPILSSASKVAARLMAEPDGEVPKSPKPQTGSDSAALASPAVNLKSAGHQAQTWPASINLPSTPVEEPLGTVIPFIPDNWKSHQQSHAPQLVDIKPSTAGLQVSTASHPSTLPEGGPSLVVGDQFTSSSSTTTTIRNSPEQTFGEKSQDLDQVIMEYLKSSSLKSLSDFTDRFYRPTGATQEPFKFEDRPLNGHERKGLYQLFLFLGGSWILAGFLGR